MPLDAHDLNDSLPNDESKVINDNFVKIAIAQKQKRREQKHPSTETHNGTSSKTIITKC